MTKILKLQTQSCGATSGRVQFDKTYFYSWKCERKNGKFEIKNIECELKVNDTSMVHLKVKEVLRKLGVHTCPQLQWDS